MGKDKHRGASGSHTEISQDLKCVAPLPPFCNSQILLAVVAEAGSDPGQCENRDQADNGCRGPLRHRERNNRPPQRSRQSWSLPATIGPGRRKPGSASRPATNSETSGWLGWRARRSTHRQTSCTQGHNTGGDWCSANALEPRSVGIPGNRRHTRCRGRLAVPNKWRLFFGLPFPRGRIKVPPGRLNFITLARLRAIFVCEVRLWQPLFGRDI